MLARGQATLCHERLLPASEYDEWALITLLERWSDRVDPDKNMTDPAQIGGMNVLH